MEIIIPRKKIQELLEQKQRLDGRALLEFRPIKVEKGVSSKAEGSALVKLGSTEVIAGVKLELEKPFPDASDEGLLIVTAELWPLASEEFELGPPTTEAIELARLVDRAIRESGFIDLKQLCIKKGELCWAVYVDIYPINDCGNLIDAAALAARLAVEDAKFPVRKEDKIEYGNLTQKHLPLKEPPVTITLYKIGKEWLLDPITAEEKAAEARLTCSFTSKGIHALQKGGDGVLEVEEINKAIKIAFDHAKIIASL